MVILHRIIHRRHRQALRHGHQTLTLFSNRGAGSIVNASAA
jgi:hypothetical protein